MNKHILMSMNAENHTKEELKENARAAYAVAHIADVAAAYDDDSVNYWINRYFELTGEDREEYEKAIKEANK